MMNVSGLLCNAFVEEIIVKVIAAEDIPADTATQLVVVFSLIQQKAPQVFPVSNTSCSQLSNIQYMYWKNLYLNYQYNIKDKLGLHIKTKTVHKRKIMNKTI